MSAEYIKKFFTKTFQRTDRFLVEIVDPMASTYGDPPDATQIRTVRLPTYQLSTEKTLEASNLYTESFTLVNLSEGFTFDIVFEENLNADVMSFITSNIKRTITNTGFYRPPSSVNRPNITVKVLDETNKTVLTYTMKDCKMTSYDPLTLDYSASESMVINVSFMTNEMTIERGR